MNKKNKKFNRIFSQRSNQSGAAMLIAVIFLIFISLAVIAGLVVPSVREYKVASESISSKKSYFLAESGVEDAYYRILNNKPIASSETINLDSNSTTTSITSNNGKKEIVSLGNVSNYQRKVNLSLTSGVGASFNYGVQVGLGGLDIQGSSGINGNVYANGPITGSTSAYISGTAISANSSPLAVDQTNGTGNPDYNTYFENSMATEDIAQSFKLSTSSPLNQVAFYMKKVGNPNSATIKIVNDVNGSPGSTVYASTNLGMFSVYSYYAWLSFAFDTKPILSANTTYWLVIDASYPGSSGYYVIGASNGGYSNGTGKTGQFSGTWNDTTPSGLDYFFSISLGGITGLIQGSSLSQYNQLSVGTSGSGTAQAHTVNYTEATGLIYCQSGTGNNKSCTTQTDPAYVAFPITDANIITWQSEAQLGGTYDGNYSTPSYGTSTIGPKLINGNLNVTGSHTLYVAGTLWVKGNITVSGSAKIVLDDSYGNNSGVILSNGWLDLEGSGQLNGTGQAGSYLLFVTTSSSSAYKCSTKPDVYGDICVSGAAGSVILNAQNGTIVFTGSASAKEATAYKMVLIGNDSVNYESGLANVNFTSGPSGSWHIGGWKEAQ